MITTIYFHKMKHYLYRLFAFFIILAGCGEKTDDSVDTRYSSFISAYTSGIVSSNSKIKIKLINRIDSAILNTPLDDVFKFKPKISGSAYWEKGNTIVFAPESKLEQGTKYKATFNLDKIEPKAKELGAFDFSFQTIPQNMEVTVEGLIISHRKKSPIKIHGYVETADEVETEKLEQVLSASQEGTDLEIIWEHNEKSNRHLFDINKVQKKESASEVKISWNGKPIGVSKRDEISYNVPGKNDFSVMSAQAKLGSANYVSVLFSDAIDEKQNLKGFVRLNGNLPRFVINGNEMKLYLSQTTEGMSELMIFKNIKSINGIQLKDNFVLEIEIPNVQPEIKLEANSGAILPNSQGLILPFSATGLKAVDVSVVRIFQENVLQYLQVNNPGERSELRRVGRPVLRKTINLRSADVTNLNKWNRFTIDLNKMISVEPGSFYQVHLSIRKQHSLFYCEETGEDDLYSLEEENWDDAEEESSYWDNYEEEAYDWRERDNPCHSSYYRNKKAVSQIIMASNIGVIAKKSDHGDLKVFTTNLIDTEPLGDVDITVYDYQQQAIGSGTTNGDGTTDISIQKGKPYVLVAKQEDQYAYLKLDDASSLSLSNFNITGQKNQKGLKGFIFGERGVWRPGDTIFLTFVLEDQQQVLPEDYPVVLEFYDPYGRLRQKLVETESVHGVYAFDPYTHEDDYTGTWQAKVKAGGAVFYENIKIETVKANRLKIDLDFNKEKLTALDQSIKGDLNVKWLHGADAPYLKASYYLTLSPTKTTFEDYPNYTFDDQTQNFYAGQQEIFSGSLDQKGNATINVDIDLDDNSPGALKATFTGKVFEEGGEFSIDNFSIPYYPYKTFVGVKTPEGDKRGMLLTDEDHDIQIVCVDAYGKPVSRDYVNVALYKLSWKWWWDQSSDDISNYVGRSYNQTIDEGQVSLSRGKGTWNLHVKYPEWGRYYVKVTDPVSGHSTGKIIYMDWPGWAGKGKKEMGGISMLDFEVDKESYEVGDEIKITFPSSPGGRALVSLESGQEVMKSFWVETKDQSTVATIEATSDMAPNIYAHITLLQPHSQTANDLPIRMYGIQSIKVVDPNTLLNPVLDIPEVLVPKQTFKVKVSEKKGKAMAYTIAMVDEGLLDLTQYKTPNPWKTFYSREALGVKTWDLFDNVIGAYGGKIERLLAIGGGAEFEANEDQTNNRFEPVVRYLGPFFLDVNDTQTHEIDMPQYIGSVRTMIVAAKDGAYGSSEKTTPVKQSVMVLATLPRVAGPNEEMDLPVTVFVSDENIRSVDVSVRVEGQLAPVGSMTKKVTFDKVGEKVIYFKVRAKEALGVGKVKVETKSGAITAQHEIALNVRASNPEVTDVTSKLIGANDIWKPTYSPLGIATSNSAVIELSALPALNIDQRLQYLIQYPHGCVEQTTSSVFAQLYLGELVALSESREDEVAKNITAAIERLKGFKTANGGFSYWPGDNLPSEWGTNYAGHFLIEAKKRGYAVPEYLLDEWVKYQKTKSNQWTAKQQRNDDLIQSYRLYVLALADETNMAAMNRMKSMPEISDVAKWRLASAYAVAGHKAAAQEIISGVSAEVTPYAGNSMSYGSDIRDKAMILETLSALDRKEEAYALLEEIANAMGDNKRWMSTQTTAYGFIGIVAYTKGKNLGEDLAFKVEIDGSTESHDKGNYLTQIGVIEADKQQSIQIINEGETPIYARLVRRGIPTESAEIAAAENIKMSVVYKNTKGQTIDPTTIKQGTDFMAVVTVSNPGGRGYYEDLALTQIFPSGWEIINSRLADAADDIGDKPEYLDIRDDRVMQYFDLTSRDTKRFIVRLNASYKGKFYLPSVAVEAMYDNSIHARTNGQWVKVVE